MVFLLVNPSRSKIFWLWGAPHPFSYGLTVLSSGLDPGPSSRPWATQATYAPPPTHQRGPRPFWWDPAQRWEGGSGAAWRPSPGSGLPMSVGAQAGFACQALGPDYRGWLSGGYLAGFPLPGFRIGPLGLSRQPPVRGFQPSFNPLFQLC
jgi:hypothetical protein